MTYLSIIISQTDLETSQILETLKSLETQTFTDYEIIALNTLKTSPHFKTYDSPIQNKIIYTNTKKISPNIKNAKGEYILFLNENYQFYSENTLQTFTNMLKQETPELLHSNENTQNNTLPLNLLYNTFYKNNFIKNITNDLSFNTPLLSLYFGPT
ncbi:glycosyltransferase family A protein [Methanosphaera sp. ISO3-F5]|uniref:glycosyltransferase family A protein n=1 Tax=Methanosphaera sp. ISO3-F5 TaxID=1452353 RepID=UPI002B262E60|nr:glycosyltransferase family A protein [Methanosphaera sp. ISO3-F5]WQH63429.1 glycosyltransferase family A protein [Methanosphaera sp. ISO3-F5]